MKYTIEQLKDAVQQSNSYPQLFRKLGYKSKTLMRSIRLRIMEEIKSNSIDVSHLEAARIQARRNSKYCLEDILIKDSPYQGSGVKDRLFKEGLLKNECCECGITKWKEKPITLQLDHINGVNNDNRIENLRILCPNCHTQTPTYSGRNIERRKIPIPICACGKEMKKGSKICKTCQDKNQETVKWPPDEELFELVKTLGVKKAAVRCGCWSTNLIHRLSKKNFDYSPYYRSGRQSDLL